MKLRTTSNESSIQARDNYLGFILFFLFISVINEIKERYIDYNNNICNTTNMIMKNNALCFHIYIYIDD